MKHFEFQLHESDIRFLQKNIRADSAIIALRSAKEKGPILVKGKYNADKYKVILPEDAVLIILDELSDILSSKGLDDYSEPNSLGRRIESLIDIFSVGYDE